MHNSELAIFITDYVGRLAPASIGKCHTLALPDRRSFHVDARFHKHIPAAFVVYPFLAADQVIGHRLASVPLENNECSIRRPGG